MKLKGIVIFITSLIINVLSGDLLITKSSAQEADITVEDITQFAQILNVQQEPSIFPIALPLDQKVEIYWIHPDRRGALAFYDRIQSYIGEQNCKMYYRWTWPVQTIGSNVEFKDTRTATKDPVTIMVFDGKKPIPPSLSSLPNVWFIRIGASSNREQVNLSLPKASPAIMDLSAQYLMGGIVKNNTGKIESGNRLSFLPAAYFDLNQSQLHYELDSLLQNGLDSAAYPGAETIVVYKGSVIYQRNIGYHTAEKRFRVQTHDLYDLASVTKVVGGINALMSLYDQGKFDFKDQLQDYFPYFRRSDKGPLSIQRILTHSAGLFPYMIFYKMAEKEKGGYVRNTLSRTHHGHFSYKVSDSLFVSDRFNRYIYKSIKESPLSAGHPYVYSGLFFLLIPDLVRQQTDMPLDQFLDQNIFRPMGATHITYNPGSKYNIHQIIPTEQDNYWRHRLVHGQVHDEAALVLRGVSANAGLFSNALDLAKVGETWRNKGSYGGQQFWKPETIQTFTQCYYCDEGNRRALGFDRPPLPDQSISSYMSPLASQESFGHSGFTGTLIWVDPTYEYTFIFLSNRVYPNRENSGLSKLNIRPDLHSVLYKMLNNKKKP